MLKLNQSVHALVGQDLLKKVSVGLMSPAGYQLGPGVKIYMFRLCIIFYSMKFAEISHRKMIAKTAMWSGTTI